MKRVMNAIQGAALIVFAVAVVLASFVPVMFYVAAAAMPVMAVAAILEPSKQVGCPEVFTAQYREQYHTAA